MHNPNPPEPVYSITLEPAAPGEGFSDLVLTLMIVGALMLVLGMGFALGYHEGSKVPQVEKAALTQPAERVP